MGEAMKRVLAAIALVVATFVPILAAQTGTKSAGKSAAACATAFTGKWAGTFTMQRPDGTEGNAQNVVFDLTQKGKVLTGTAGPADKQWNIDKGAVDAGKATFDVQQPNGPLFKFTLTIVKGRLQGDMAGERDGVVRGHAKVDAARVAAAKAK